MKACLRIVFLLIPVFFLYSGVSTAQENSMNPVSPNASPQAKALLKFFYSISGKYILTGQKLQEAHVPIIWRPYHEMNGDWFWWGGGKRTITLIFEKE